VAWKFKEFFSRKSGFDQPDANACFERGNALISQQQWQAALDCFEEATSLNPNHAEAHAHAGNVLRLLRKPDAALRAYDRAIALRPSYAEVHYNRGVLLHNRQQAREALDSFDRALSINASFAEARFRRAEVLRELGRLDEAEASYRETIALRPDFADAYFNLGTLLMTLGQPHAAVASFDMAIRVKPDFARAYGNRAQAEAKAGLLAEGRASHEQAVLLDPQDAALHFNFGVFLSDIKSWEEAAASYRTAIALDPGNADAYCNLGLAQQEAGQGDAALNSYARAIEINPRLATAFNNRGNVFRSRKLFTEAMLDYRQALALDPTSAEAHFNVGQLALLLGDFALGWAEYEWRGLIAEGLAVNTRKFSEPAWFGEFPIEGKHLYLHVEQGIGDTIQFCRYVRLVAELGARVTLEVQPPLGELLANLDGVSELVLLGAPIPSADYQCSVMSLPGAFKTTLATIPCEVPYIHAEPHKISRWHEVLGPRTRPRIGLAWSGNPGQSNDHNRSVELSRWIGYLPEEFAYVCLQKDIRDRDRNTLNACARIATVESHLRSFSDTAALLETLDLIIAVDTSVAHLSGAMGKKTWILLCYLPDWRYLLDRRDSPWYPTATLYRQPVAGDWESVFAEVKKDLLLMSW